MTIKAKLFLAATFLLLFPFGSEAARDRLISFQELPEEARTFVQKHFSEYEVLLVKYDTGPVAEYEVKLSKGVEIEFDRTGRWKEVSCPRTEVPASVLPSLIGEYVRKNFPTMTVTAIERDRLGFEVELSRALELKFDKNCNFVRIDD